MYVSWVSAWLSVSAHTDPTWSPLSPGLGSDDSLGSTYTHKQRNVRTHTHTHSHTLPLKEHKGDVAVVLFLKPYGILSHTHTNTQKHTQGGK